MLDFLILNKNFFQMDENKTSQYFLSTCLKTMWLCAIQIGSFPQIVVKKTKLFETPPPSNCIYCQLKDDHMLPFPFNRCFFFEVARAGSFKPWPKPVGHNPTPLQLAWLEVLKRPEIFREMFFLIKRNAKQNFKPITNVKNPETYFFLDFPIRTFLHGK